LPFPDPDRLVMVWSRLQDNRNSTAAGDFLEWKLQASVFQDLNAWTLGSVNLATGERPESVPAARRTPGFLTMVGHRFALGRDFTQDEAIAGKDQVVILSHRLWEERFGADANIIGRQTRINGKPFTVVGVLVAGSADRLPARLHLPLVFTPEQQ